MNGSAVLRKTRDFWYVADSGNVERTTGYACEGTPDYWWCPAVGVSAAEGYSLFRDRVDAYEKAHAICRRNLDTAQAVLNRIEAERWATDA